MSIEKLRKFDHLLGVLANEFELKLTENYMEYQRMKNGSTKIISAKSLCFGDEYVTVDMHDGTNNVVMPLRATFADFVKRNKLRVHINTAKTSEELGFDNKNIFNVAEALNHSIEKAASLIEAMQEDFAKVLVEDLISE